MIPEATASTEGNHMKPNWHKDLSNGVVVIVMLVAYALVILYSVLLGL